MKACKEINIAFIPYEEQVRLKITIYDFLQFSISKALFRNDVINKLWIHASTLNKRILWNFVIV